MSWQQEDVGRRRAGGSLIPILLAVWQYAWVDVYFDGVEARSRSGRRLAVGTAKMFGETERDTW